MNGQMMIKNQSRGLLPPLQNTENSNPSQVFLINESVSSNHLQKGFQRFNTRRETELIFPADPLCEKYDVFPHGLFKVKSPDFRRANTRRETQFVLPSDPFLDKFEKISWKLGKIIDQGQAKLLIDKVKPASPRMVFDELAQDTEKKDVRDPGSRKATLNKHAIRSQIFENTSKWLSPRAVVKKRKVF